MHYLKAGVHAVVVDDDLVILDLRADDYLCIPAGAAGFHAPSSQGAAHVSGPLALVLGEAGLLSSIPQPARRPLPAPPDATLIHDSPGPMGLRDLRALVTAVLAVRKVEATPGILSLLGIAGDPAQLDHSQGAVLRAAGAFWQVQPWLPFDGECLQRSMALVAFLRALGLRADWVFGVRLWPFSAHCWVQSGAICLNDDHERLKAYTPIFCQ